MGLFDKVKEALGGAKESDHTQQPSNVESPFQETAADQGAADTMQESSQATTSDAGSAVGEVDPSQYAGKTWQTNAADPEPAAPAATTEPAAEPMTEPTAEPTPDAVPMPEPAAEPLPQAEPETPMPEADPAPAPMTYEVVSGDNLSVIGDRFGVSVDDLVATNNIENPDLIYPGQILTIPQA